MPGGGGGGGDYGAGLEQIGKEATQNAVASVREGISYSVAAYDSTMNQAIMKFQEAQEMAAPFVGTATAALAEMNSLLGLDPISPTKSSSDGFRALASQFYTTMSPTYGEQKDSRLDMSQVYGTSATHGGNPLMALSNLVAEAERETDPAMRAQLKQQVMQQAQITKDVIGSEAWRSNHKGQYDKQAYSNLIQESMQNVDRLSQEWEDEYLDEPEEGLTNEEISEKITNLPNYQFRYEQGKQALERSQAARGNLLSGNSLLEAQEYGQEYAKRAYQEQLGYLSGLAGTAMPMTGQAQGQLQQQGQSALSAGAQTASTVGQQYNAEGQAYLQGGALQLQGATAAAQMQMQSDQMSAQSGSGMMGAAGNIVGTILGGLF